MLSVRASSGPYSACFSGVRAFLQASESLRYFLATSRSVPLLVLFPLLLHDNCEKKEVEEEKVFLLLSLLFLLSSRRLLLHDTVCEPENKKSKADS